MTALMIEWSLSGILVGFIGAILRHLPIVKDLPIVRSMGRRRAR